MSDVKSMAVIGAGTMGSGIALVAAMSGLKAWQVDVAPAQLDRARASHEKILNRNVEKGRMSAEDAKAAAGRIAYATDMAEAREADWVVEAVVEKADLKKSLFAKMRETFRNDV